VIFTNNSTKSVKYHPLSDKNQKNTFCGRNLPVFNSGDVFMRQHFFEVSSQLA
jgi:hypothetical protein